MAAPQQLADGTFRWFGGMDMSRAPYDVDESQYVKGVNVAITLTGANLQPRPGWRFQQIKFKSPKEQGYFETGHIQGGDWFFDGAKDSLVLSINGILYFLQEETYGVWKAKTLNLGNPNNPTRTKVWTCRIPGNRLVVSDGQNLPYVIGRDGTFTRPDPSSGQMSVCRMMAYVQHRLWWVDETSTIIYGSDLADPLSIQEALDTNLFGFLVMGAPDDRDKITAIGQQRYINLDQNGGELVFSTTNNIYAVNVPANVTRELWGAQGIGTVRMVIPGVGATSAYSFENYNANLFFRTNGLGVANYKQTQAQFAQGDELISNSIEVDYWFRNDTQWMLDQCYTVNYKSRLLTTTQPSLKDGYVFWRGLVSMNPAPYYGGQNRLPRRFEGLWTGVRPWLLIHQKNTIEKLFTVSLDGDLKNRLYMLDDNNHFDIGPHGKREIESIVETRAYAFKSIDRLKVVQDRYYTLDQINSDVSLKAYSRSNLLGQWFPFAEQKLYQAQCCPDNCLPFNPVSPESRDEKRLPAENTQDCVTGRPGMSVAAPVHQYRLEFTGQLELSRFGLLANTEPDDQSVACVEKNNRIAREPICQLTDFNYFIVPPLITTQEDPSSARKPFNSPPSGDCACQ